MGPHAQLTRQLVIKAPFAATIILRIDTTRAWVEVQVAPTTSRISTRMPRTLTTLWRKTMLSTQRISQRKSVRARMQRIQMLPPQTKVVMREAHPKRSPLKVARAGLAPCQMTTHWLWELEPPLWSPTLTRARSKGQSKTVRKALLIQIMFKAV